MSVLVRSSSLDWVWLCRIVALVFALYDTMCYDYEHGASDTCNATDVFLTRQISGCRATLSRMSCLIDVNNMDTLPGIR